MGEPPAELVFRPRYRKSISLFFGAFMIFFGCEAAFSSNNNAALSVLAAFSLVCICAARRPKVVVEPAGLKIIRTSRTAARTIAWSDIDRFEKRSGVNQSPVTLISASDQASIALPTFPKPQRRPIPPSFEKYHALVQAQVDEINALLEEHRADVQQSRAHTN